jgi:hypothetical protein
MEEAMSSIPVSTDRWAYQQKPEVIPAPAKHHRVAGFILRTIFIAALLIVIARVSLPQSSTIWTVYDNPGDLVRLLLGAGACVWIAVQMFTAPKDPHSYGAWFYIGLAAVPFALICIAGIW